MLTQSRFPKAFFNETIWASVLAKFVQGYWREYLASHLKTKIENDFRA